jgi:phosphatidate cytidylyltransferase
VQSTGENAGTMKRVLTAVVLIPIVLLIVFRAPVWLFTSVIALVAILALFEFAGLVRGHGYDVDRGILLVLFIVFFAFAIAPSGFDGWQLGFMVLAGILLMAVAMGRTDLRFMLPSCAAGVLALLYIAATLMALVGLRAHPWGKFLILYLFVVVWSGDTFAYYTGRAIGRHKLAPRISPGKTWEGTIASIFGSTLLGLLMFVFASSIVGFLMRIGLLQTADAVSSPAWLSPPIWMAVVLSICINVAAQFGDLVESAIKRGAGVKDSGTLLPGHGGILDRIDALLFAAPVGLILIRVLLPTPLP